MSNADPTRHKTLFRRILIPSLLVLSLGMALLALFQWLHTRALIKDTLTSESEQVMAATDSALHYLMLQADEEGLQKTLDRLAASQDIRRGYILGVSGGVYRSSGKAASDPVPSNVLEEARHAALHVSEEADGDREYLRSLKPIVAEQSCLSCHPGVRNGDLIGYIGIERWMDASTAQARSMQVWAAAIDVLILVAMGLVLAFLIRRVTGPIQKMTATARLLAAGDLDSDLTYTAEDEIGDLAEAMRSLTGYLRELCRLAEALSRGDLTVELTARSADDMLTEKLNQARSSLGGVIQEIEEVARAAAQGDLSRRGNHQAFQGAFRQMIQSVNTTLDAVLDPIHEATRVLERVAGRDLTARVRGDYHGDHARVKQAVNQAVENLEASLHQVAASASQVAAASGQISSGSQSLAQGSSQQASTLQEVASSLQEVASMAASNASFAQEAQTLAVQARESSTSGMKNMEKLSEAIRKIKTSADETAKIVRTIDEIAFQTNLLALNAAVEAARAGEAGKGFAVVAGEVRNLAIRCAEAAKNTALLIEGSVRNSEEGVKINSQVLQDLEEITQQVERVSQGMQEIATASEQQRLGIDQVANAVSQMGQLTQTNAANAEESASAAEELSGQAEELTELVGGFQLTAQEGSTKAAAKAQAAPSAPEATRVKPNGKDRTSRRPARNLILDDSEGRLSQF